MLRQRTDPKKDALCCNLVNLFTPYTYLEHLEKTAAMGNLPKQFILFVPGFPALPVGSMDRFSQCP